MKGIDVYDGNGLIDFDQVKAAGYDFVIIKCGGNEGSRWIARNFYRSYVKARAAGLHVGAYWYAGDSRGRDAGIADARYCYSILRGTLLDFPVFYDFEHSDASQVWANTKACEGFCSTMESYKYYVGIYGSDISVFNEMLDKSLLTQYDWWVARYGRKPVNHWDIWQYASDGDVPGVDGYCDLNECKVDYPAIITSKGFNGYLPL